MSFVFGSGTSTFVVVTFSSVLDRQLLPLFQSFVEHFQESEVLQSKVVPQGVVLPGCGLEVDGLEVDGFGG